MFRQFIFSVAYCLGNIFLNVVIGKDNTYLHVVYLVLGNTYLHVVCLLGNTFLVLHIDR